MLDTQEQPSFLFEAGIAKTGLLSLSSTDTGGHMRHSVGGVLSAVGWTLTSLLARFPPRVWTGPVPRCDNPNQKSPDIAERAPAGLGAHTPLLLENQGLKGNGRSGNHCRGPLDVVGGGWKGPCSWAVFIVKHRFWKGSPSPALPSRNKGLPFKSCIPAQG